MLLCPLNMEKKKEEEKKETLILSKMQSFYALLSPPLFIIYRITLDATLSSHAASCQVPSLAPGGGGTGSSVE